MQSHLFQTLSEVEAKFYSCGIIIAGDFNRLNVNQIIKHFRLKQIVKSPTRGEAILDLILTNMHESYKSPQILPPIGLSDHNTVVVSPTHIVKKAKPTFVYKRDLRQSKKDAMGRFLQSILWPEIFAQSQSCEDMANFFYDIVSIGLDLLMPIKRIKKISADVPWMTDKLKTFIKKRQEAFFSYGPKSNCFKYYRNIVNRERKACKSKYYTTQVHSKEKDNPKAWWSEIKRLGGMKSMNSSLINLINIAGLEDISEQELANRINTAFLEPLSEYQLSSPLDRLNLEENPDFLEVSEERVLSQLQKLNSSKSGGPDEVPNWLLREYAVILALPISLLLNASYKQQRLPAIWKLANVSPLPKVKIVQDLKKELRPISLTPNISKVAEHFVVNDYVKPAVLKKIDPNQYGAIPKSSTIFALLSMVHNWTSGLDGTGSTTRIILFDYQKAFDLIDHRILFNKLLQLDLPRSVINWIIDFLSNRFQRVKLSQGCFSDWGAVPSGVPQGTILGPWLFLILINDLSITDTDLWKYVDDTTVSETVDKNQQSRAQTIANEMSQWSQNNKMKLNEEKCKELRISFSKVPRDFNPILINNKSIRVVKSVKLLGLSFDNNLTWNLHIEEVVKKVSKRIYYLIQLKRASIPRNDLVLFYVTCIRSVIDYGIPVIYYSLPKYLRSELERLQKRAIRIICPNTNYEDALISCGLESLSVHHENICTSLFQTVVADENHKLRSLLPPTHTSFYDLRNDRKFEIPRCNTNRFQTSFFVASCRKSFI